MFIRTAFFLELFLTVINDEPLVLKFSRPSNESVDIASEWRDGLSLAASLSAHA